MCPLLCRGVHCQIFISLVTSVERKKVGRLCNSKLKKSSSINSVPITTTTKRKQTNNMEHNTTGNTLKCNVCGHFLRDQNQLVECVEGTLNLGETGPLFPKIYCSCEKATVYHSFNLNHNDTSHMHRSK